MMQIIFCDDITCKHNECGMVCSKERVHIIFTETNEFEQGKRVCYNTCADYEERKNADD